MMPNPETSGRHALRDRYESIPKRDFKTALVRLLENEYGILNSRRIIMMLADDIEDMVGEYFPMKSRVKFGDVVWYTTADDGQRVSYGKKTEDYNVKQVILPLVVADDIESRMAYKDKSRNGNYRKNKERDIKTMVRLIKSAKEQGGLLSGAEVSVLMNRSLSTIGKYLKAYHEDTGEILPMKGYVLDQGSNPTHKGIIISLYEQGISPSDIVLKTGHNQESVDRYIKVYDQVLLLTRSHHSAESICEIIGRSMHTVRQYLRLVKNFHPEQKVDVPEKVKKTGAEN